MKRIVIIIMVTLMAGSVIAQEEVVFELSKNIIGWEVGKESSNIKVCRISNLNETIEIKGVNKSILNYYQIAYDNIPEFQFTFPEELNFISSDLYNLTFSGNKEQLIEQLNTQLGLTARKIEKEYPVLVLKEIKQGKNIKQINPENEGTSMSTTKGPEIHKYQGQITEKIITQLIEEKSKHLVVLDPSIKSSMYEIDFSIKANTSEEELINAFKEAGIILAKDKQTIELIEIDKSVTPILF